MEAEEIETKRELTILGILFLIGGWYSVWSTIDLAFVRKSEAVSQPFFSGIFVMTLIFLMISIWFVTRYPRYLGTIVAGANKEVLAAERERVKDVLKKVNVCFVVFSLIMISLSLAFPSLLLFFLSGMLIITLGGIISSMAVLLAVMKD